MDEINGSKIVVKRIYPIDFIQQKLLGPKGFEHIMEEGDKFTWLESGLVVYTVEEDKVLSARKKIVTKPGLYRLVNQGGLFDSDWVLQQEVEIDRSPFFDDLPAVIKLNEIVLSFVQNESVYLEKSLFPKIGIMLYGPPGNGKTASVMELAKGLLTDTVVIVAEGTSEMFDGLKDILPSISLSDGAKRIMIVLEDIGGAGAAHEDTLDNSVFLELLDNSKGLVKSPIIYIMTTNYPELIKENVINRPGRVDYLIKYSGIPLENKQRFLRFLGASEELVSDPEVIDYLRSEHLTMSHVKEAYIRHLVRKISFIEALQEVKEQIDLFNDSFEDGGKIGI